MADKTEKRRQYAALPIRVTPAGELEVLLITSRETRRWVIPKGWPMKGHKPGQAAMIEAHEEAGLEGQLAIKPKLGHYSYVKRQLDGTGTEIRVDVYAMLVEGQASTWKEQGQREMKWLTAEAAAEMVAEPGLAKIVARLPALFGGREACEVAGICSDGCATPGATKGRRSRDQY